MSDRFRFPDIWVRLCVASALGALGCDVGRSVLVPLDATTQPADSAVDGGIDAAVDAAVDSGVDASVGTRTCSDFATCAASCGGATFATCVQGCARDLRASSRPLVDSLLTCVRSACDGGLEEQCGSMAIGTRCGAQVTACTADGGPTDGGVDVPLTDGGLDAPPTDGGCPAGQLLCGGACTPVLTNPMNCGACGHACSASQTCNNGACIGTGHLRFTLNWDRPGDVDLHVVPPCGTDIYFGNRVACGGELDRDDTTGTGPENTFWRTSAAPGTYLVCVVPFGGVAVPTQSTVDVFIGTTLITTLRRTLMTSGSGSRSCSRTSPDFVGEFVLGGDGGVPTDVPADVVTPVDVPVGTNGCAAAASCVTSCPERDLDCMRGCAAGLSGSAMTLFNNLLRCDTDACGAGSSFSCFSAISESLCSTQIAACLADTAGMYTPPCPTPGESRCGAACVNTSFQDTANCGTCGHACAAGEACSFGVCVQRGNTVFSLQWDALGDVDLVVHTPCNNAVSGRNPSACGATFGRSDTASVGPESISFAAAPMPGTYRVCAIPRTTLRPVRTDASSGMMFFGARVSVDRAGMPLQIFPVPTGGTPANSRLGGEYQSVFRVSPDATTDDCPAGSPYHVADIVL